MNHQIIEHADFRAFFNVQVILFRSDEETSKNFRGKFTRVDGITHFHFSKFGNYYQRLRKFNEILNQRTGIIVSNDGLELESFRKFGSKSAIFSIVHDFYNLRLVIGNLDLIDYFICHTETYAKTLQSNYSLRERTVFLLHGVRYFPQNEEGNSKERGQLKIVSIARLAETKGVLLLHEIDRMLKEKVIAVDWTIIGSGELEDQLRQQWRGSTNVQFYQPDSVEEVYDIARACDVFISPSTYEGYGIALLEAMSCSLVPVIHKLPVGIYSDLPSNAGFSIAIGDEMGFADAIAALNNDRELMALMKKNCNELIRSKYDIGITAHAFLDFFKKNYRAKKEDKNLDNKISSAGILDHPMVPEQLTRFIRKRRSGL